MSDLVAAARLRRPGVVALTVVGAVVINLVIYALGSALGASFDFTSAAGAAHVDAFTLAAVLARRRWVVPVAAGIAVTLAIVTVPVMVFAVDFDTASAITLTAAHLAVGAAAVVGLLLLRLSRP
ncbi:hypothetical protein JNUCC0626_07005 [Lentzea sp. JNUCC 0626]|uniref:hypothetical protein n=1 Tax=Lentzea sp. JNUCC 0626 TaxID=3367513 RepID=UPI003749C250